MKLLYSILIIFYYTTRNEKKWLIIVLIYLQRVIWLFKTVNLPLQFIKGIREVYKGKLTANAFLKFLRLSCRSLTLAGSQSIMNCKSCWAADEQVAASFLVSNALKNTVIFKFKMQIWNSVLTFITLIFLFDGRPTHWGNVAYVYK